MPDPSSLKRSTAFKRSISSNLILIISLLLAVPSLVLAQTSQRWFQIEVSIFSNESQADRNEEFWQAERSELNYPSPLRRLTEASDLLITDQMIADAIAAFIEPSDLTPIEDVPAILDEEALAAAERAEQLAALLATGPRPVRPEGDFKFFDFLRDPYIQLGSQESDFQQTNRAIERSSEHRLLFHGLWRESLADANQAIPLYVQGGLRYNDQHELQGTITVRFNENRDRIVIDSNLWLTEFSASADLAGDWSLPKTPATVIRPLDTIGEGEQNLEYGINRVYAMTESREMRSTEFHYIDHPAMGIVILVEPYDIPDLPVPDFDFHDPN